MARTQPRSAVPVSGRIHWTARTKATGCSVSPKLLRTSSASSGEPASTTR
jgi:hypothetical protein